MIIHLVAQFLALAHAHGYRVHQSHGPYGWVLWVQPRGLSYGLGQVHGHVVSWLERR